MLIFDPRSEPTPPGPFSRSANVTALVVLVMEELRWARVCKDRRAGEAFCDAA
jgi:hypothetical protein